MYPQINHAGGFTNPTAGEGESTSGANGFGGPPNGPNESMTTLRVVVAEKFRVAPPVPVPAAASAPMPERRSSDAGASLINFDYEKKILRELETPGNLATAAVENKLRRQDKYEALLSQCVSSGYTRDEAALALAVALAVTGHRADRQAVAQAASNVRQLFSMGFKEKKDVVGALVAKNGILHEALEIL